MEAERKPKTKARELVRRMNPEERRAWLKVSSEQRRDTRLLADDAGIDAALSAFSMSVRFNGDGGGWVEFW